MAKNLVLWMIIAGVLLTVFNNINRDPQADSIIYSQFVQELREGRVQAVDIQNLQITGYRSDGSRFRSIMPAIGDRGLMDELLESNVAISGTQEEKPGFLSQLFLSLLPVLVIVGLFFFFMRQMQGGGGGGKGGPMSFGKSKAKLLGEDQIKVTFADVAGVDEAKEDVQELVEFLREPDKFQRLGGKIPRGILMVGQPGTGKTLLAKAIAGEAKVPFFSISGSDFVEMFVGVGASRVRDMFEQAKKAAPCIIFIDDIDAVGRHRGAGLGGGHDEREQTLNQLLVEMDGFESNEGVILISATNRPDVLDPALLRPGRFDRQVVVPLPDIRGRQKILEVHMKRTPVAADVNVTTLAKGTPGFSGADLANLVNEAALFAARGNKKLVTMAEFERAKDKIMMGAERKSMIMKEEEKKLTAYHEAGHAIVGRFLPETDAVNKITIVPRGRAAGVTWFLPEERDFKFKDQLESELAVAFGGRAAEDIIFNRISTGAANDIKQATGMAQKMVRNWG